ncbi:hypothetical protein LINGRAHAP2_LOCUS28513 [Linum grandiflorum]
MRSSVAYSRHQNRLRNSTSCPKDGLGSFSLTPFSNSTIPGMDLGNGNGKTDTPPPSCRSCPKVTSSPSKLRMETFLCSPFYYDFYDRILGLAAESPLLREIDIDFGCGRCHSPDCGMPDKSVVEYSIPESFFTPNGKQFARLDTLKLQFCAFWLYENLALTNFSCLGSSLKVLSLQHVQFPNAEIFYSMIDHASLLENLTLNDIRIGSPMKFQIQNKPNLKILNLSELYLDTLEIGGIDSLEEFRVTGTHTEEFKMSSTPNLKVLHIEGFSSMELINKLISEHPLLESLTLECPSDETRELKIVHSEKLRDVTLKYSHGDGSVVIDAPMLTNFTYQGESSYFPKISIRNPVGSSTEVVAVICLKSERVNVGRLKQFLVVLSRFQLSTVELASFGSLWGKDEEESPPPAVECLKFRAKPPSCERHLRTNLDYFFQCCHPKILCFTEPSSEQVPNSLFLPNLECGSIRTMPSPRCRRCPSLRSFDLQVLTTFDIFGLQSTAWLPYECRCRAGELYHRERTPSSSLSERDKSCIDWVTTPSLVMRAIMALGQRLACGMATR